MPKLPKIVFHFLAIVYLFQTSYCEIFSAMTELEQVLHIEKGLATDLRSYIAKEEERLAKLRSVADDYEKHSTSALQNAGKHLANPINSFLLVKRFTTDWENNVQTLIRTNSSEDFLSSLSSKLDKFPTYDDLDGAASALLRLQDTYKLSTAKLAKGEIQGVKHSPHLSAADCYELARVAYNNQDYYHTITWIQEALSQWNNEVNKTIDRPTLLDYYSYCLYMQGNYQLALKLTNEFLTLEPNHIRAQNNKRYYERLIAEEEAAGAKKGEDEVIKNERVLDEYRDSEEFRNYEALCRGENIIKYKYQHKLYCHYIKPHPYFILRPLKEEIAYFQPYIVLLHDIITDVEMDTIKKLATPKLNRATVQNPQTGKLETATYRVSKSWNGHRYFLYLEKSRQETRGIEFVKGAFPTNSWAALLGAWLKDAHHPRIKRLSKKIDLFTGLDMETAEELQVANYGIGGHYEPHFDFARMSNVEAGGATVFPYLGVKLFPVKGTAAFWFNLKKSGEGDYDTRHAACPVLTGSKWVSNKWIHERSQEFRRPCSLNDSE